MTMKTLIIGLGNPILGDDGVGWRVAEEVERTLPPFSAEVRGKWGETEGGIAEVERLSLGGISLMEQMTGWERVILVDSICTGGRAPGEVVTFSVDGLGETESGHSASGHDLTLKQALKLGRSLGADLPRNQDIHIVAIEARNVDVFGETLSPEIAAAVPRAVKAVLEILTAEGVRSP